MNCKGCTHNYKHVCTNKQSDCYGMVMADHNGCVWGESSWISVQDILPEPGILVAVTDGYNQFGLAERHGRDFFSIGIEQKLLTRVTHWFALPPLPRDDELPMPESIKNDIYDAIARGENYDGKRVSIHHSDVGYPDKTKDE